MKDLYVFGNEHLEFDSLAREISDFLKEEFNIIHCRSPDDLLDAEENEILILDVVKGIEKPVVIEDISQLKTNKMTTMHDFDLGFFLNLMKELGINKKIKIIGVPQRGNKSDILEKVRQWS